MKIEKSQKLIWSKTSKEDKNVDMHAKALHEFTEKHKTKDQPSRHIYTISDNYMHKLVDWVYDTSVTICDMPLWPYQQEFSKAIIRSLLFEKVSTITALFARQSGKTETISVILCGLTVLLPLLASEDFLKKNGLDTAIAKDSRIAKYRLGFSAGIFTPTKEISTVIKNRVVARMQCKTMTDFRNSPMVDIKVAHNKNPLKLPNGSYIEITSAAPQAKIEGRTFHLIVTEETQDIDSWVIQKSITPMGSATAATFVKIGTPNLYTGDFYQACFNNRREDLEHPSPNDRKHFEYDYLVCCRYNESYRKYVEKVRRENDDGNTDSFRMSYKLEWLTNDTRFITDDVLVKCGVVTKKVIKAAGSFYTLFDTPVDHCPTPMRDLYFSIDVAKRRDSTVVTAGYAFTEDPVTMSGSNRFRAHILNWLDLKGDNYEVQFHKILCFMQRYTTTNRADTKRITIIIDCNGPGDPVYDRYLDALGNRKDSESCKLLGITSDVSVRVIPFRSGTQINHNGFSLFREELRSGRFTYPDSQKSRHNKNVIEFKKQLFDVQTEQVKGFLKVEAPNKKQSSSVYRDDYVDSAMQFCYAVNGNIEVEENSEITFSDENLLSFRRRGNALRRAARSLLQY